MLWVDITELAGKIFHAAVTLHNIVLFIKLLNLYMHLKKLVTWALIFISTGVEIQVLLMKCWQSLLLLPCLPLPIHSSPY
jgi:hypothetical protein